MTFTSLNQGIKVTVWLCNLGASNALLWAVIGRPVFGFLFRREAYLISWQNGMQSEIAKDKENTRSQAKFSATIGSAISNVPQNQVTSEVLSLSPRKPSRQ